MARFNLDDYITVQDRINEFWEKYPNGAILTKLESPPDNFQECRYSAVIYKDRDSSHIADAAGWAFEVVGPKGPNSTSHEENCETSAIGRALANLGFATSADKRASREEMAKVQRMSDDGGNHRSPDPTPWQQNGSTTNGNGSRGSSGDRPSDKQLNFARSLWKDLGYVTIDEDGVQHHDAASLNMYTEENWNASFEAMTKTEIGELIDALQEFKAEQEAAEAD